MSYRYPFDRTPVPDYLYPMVLKLQRTAIHGGGQIDIYSSSFKPFSDRTFSVSCLTLAPKSGLTL